MQDFKGLLSVVLPVYNEKDTIEKILQQVCAVEITKELIIVDDGSTDGTADLLERMQRTWEKTFASKYTKSIVFVFHHENKGKGAALRSGFSRVKGDVVIIQDADLEYDPTDYYRMIEPIVNDAADVVYGSRFVGGGKRRVHLFWHDVGNRFLTFLSNMLNNLNLTDMETGYKAFKSEVLKKITILSNGFDVEPELTAKIAKQKCRIYEVAITYKGRGYLEGKKITWRDGITALWTIIKYKWVD